VGAVRLLVCELAHRRENLALHRPIHSDLAQCIERAIDSCDRCAVAGVDVSS